MSGGVEVFKSFTLYSSSMGAVMHHWVRKTMGAKKTKVHMIMKKSSFTLVWWLLIKLVNSNHDTWLSSEIHQF